MPYRLAQRYKLETALRKMKPKKSPGPDGILSEFLINLGKKAKEVVLNMLNRAWDMGEIPAEWRKAEILPIHKKGKPKDQISSFRPIALTSVLCKLMERMVLARLMYYIEGKNLLSPNQAGFRRHRGAVDHVVQFSQAIKDGFQHQQATLAVLVDFSTAFDRVWRKRLLEKIGQWGVHGRLFAFIKAFLSQRFIRVRYEQRISGYRQTRQGVPQGSVLSPTLFNIMIDDLTVVLEKLIPGINALLYADDLLIWATSSSLPALERCLNDALDILAEWSGRNEMTVNPLKTAYQLFTLSPKPAEVTLSYSGTNLKKTDSAVYLGVMLDNRLTWHKHLELAAQKGNSRIKLLNRLAGATWGVTQDMLKMTYTTYVRPAILYGCEAVVTASVTAKSKIERIQNKALRNITGGAKSTPIAAMQCQADIEPIVTRVDLAAMHLYERAMRARVPYWQEYNTPKVRLPSQKNFTHIVKDKISSLGLESGEREPYPDLRFLQPLSFNTTLVGNISKCTANPVELKASALETIHTRYPLPQWLHVYTDGSAEAAMKNGGAGVYSVLFQRTEAVGTSTSSFDGEVAAILIALQEILKRQVKRAVILVDSQAAILSLGSDRPLQTRAAAECLELNQKIMDKGGTVILQWVPSHCGVWGNEAADRLAKEGASEVQPNPPVSITTINRSIKAAVRKNTEENWVMEASGKSWEVITSSEGKISARLPRRESVALFRLKTGHDFLQKHLHKIGVVNSSECPLCHEGEMDAQHLLFCPSLSNVQSENEAKNIIERYWAARRLMNSFSQTGVG